jgi:hypothetical protein
MKRCTYINTQVLFEPLLYLAKLLNMVTVRNFKVMLGQTLCRVL